MLHASILDHDIVFVNSTAGRAILKGTSNISRLLIDQPSSLKDEIIMFFSGKNPSLLYQLGLVANISIV